MSFFAQAHAQAAGTPPASDPMISFIFMAGIFVLFYFIAIRPQRKRQKERHQLHQQAQLHLQQLHT